MTAPASSTLLPYVLLYLLLGTGDIASTASYNTPTPTPTPTPTARRRKWYALLYLVLYLLLCRAVSPTSACERKWDSLHYTTLALALPLPLPPPVIHHSHSHRPQADVVLTVLYTALFTTTLTTRNLLTGRTSSTASCSTTAPTARRC